MGGTSKGGKDGRVAQKALLLAEDGERCGVVLFSVSAG